VPERDDTAASPREPDPAAHYHLPSDDEIRRAARRLVRGGRAMFVSQQQFLSALVGALRRDDPLAVVGGRRLRRLLIGIPGIRLSVHYTEREDDRPLDACPVCGSVLRPIRNRTLSGDSVVLGLRCTRCDYWTHRARRIPVRYRISSGRVALRSVP
jgi:hypothetical protein